MAVEEIATVRRVRSNEALSETMGNGTPTGKMIQSKSKKDLLSALTRAYAAVKTTHQQPQEALEQCLSPSKKPGQQSTYPPMSRKIFPGLYKNKTQGLPHIQIPSPNHEPAERSTAPPSPPTPPSPGGFANFTRPKSIGGRLDQLRQEEGGGRRWSDSFKDSINNVFSRRSSSGPRKGSDPELHAGQGSRRNSGFSSLLDSVNIFKKAPGEGLTSTSAKDQIRDSGSPRNCSMGALSPMIRLRRMRRSSSTGVTEMPKPKTYSWRVTDMYPLVPEQLYFTAHMSEAQTWQEIKKRPDLYFFSCDLQDNYIPFCSDFGPVNLAIVHHFWQYVKSKKDNPGLGGRPMVYYCDMTPESRTNTAFLLGSYLMLEHGYTADQALETFESIRPYPFLAFHDASFAPDTFKLSLRDCLMGFEKGMKLGWFDKRDFDVNTYCKLEHPLGGDITAVCHKFLAFKGPVTNDDCLSPGEWANPPSFFTDTFKQMGVTAVVRLNEPETYDANDFEVEGIRHYDLWFRDCSVPSLKLCEKFLEIAQKEEGMIAVHCKAGLGRTGTLIGLWLMQLYNFTAREAIGWMRVARPGMVIGPQQQFLEDCETRVWKGNAITEERRISGPASSKALRSFTKQLFPRTESAPAFSGEGRTFISEEESESLATNLAKAMGTRDRSRMD